MEVPRRPTVPLVTIVCPVFNEAESIPLFYERLLAALTATGGSVVYEFLFVNNRSTDTTLDVLRALRQRDARVHIVTLSRNYGYQASITAGMRHARGDAIANIDVDCEDPPEMIPRFIAKWLDGVDVVYGLRHQRQEFFLMHFGRKLFYRGIRGVADHEIVLDMAEFFLVDKRVRDAVLSTRSTFPFVRGQVGYVGFKREGIAYRRERRLVGKTHYNLLGAARFGIAGILSSSTLPLRILAYVGILGFLTDMAAATAVVLGGDRFGLSFAERLLLALFTVQIGWMMLAFGALGLYVARVYKDVIGLPLYVVDENLSFNGPSHANP